MTRVSYVSLLKYLVVAEFKTDVNRYFLGVFWWFAEPLMYVAVFYVAFSHLRAGDTDYIYFLIVGMTTWRWLSGSINAATNSIVSKKRIVSHFSINPIIFVYASLATNALKFVVLLGFVCLLLAYADRLHIAPIGAVVLWLASIFSCITACSLVAAFIVVYLPDMRVFISQGLLLLMFLSGVIFAIESVSGDIAFWLQLNPFIHLISASRYVLMGVEHGAFASGTLGLVLLCSLAVIAAMSLLSKTLSADIPKRVLL